MNFNEIFMITSNPYLSGAIWVVALMLVLYFARQPAHKIISSFTRTIHSAMRLTARSVTRAATALAERNKEVLLEQGMEAAEHKIEREFERIDATVQRDLAQYPALHRHLSEEIEQIDDHYNQSTQVPPEPPGWVKAVDAVAKIPGKDPMVASILEDIHGSMVKANTQALEEYRKASHRRHEHLKRMMPHWREVRRILTKVDKSIGRLLVRSETIDRLMQGYEDISNKTDHAVRMLASSAFKHFTVSTFVLIIAVGAAIFNFNLIAYPMQEMVGAKNEIMGVLISDIAGLVVILLELTIGIFFMESIRWTRLFPLMDTLSEKSRFRMAWILLGLLFSLAFLEAGLAFMRDELASEKRQVTMSLLSEEGQQATAAGINWITRATQMGIGFIMPFVLALVAIVIEYFIHSLRTVLGVIGVGLLRFSAWLLRLIGSITHYIGRIIINVYDFIIFAPLWVERIVKAKHNKEISAPGADTASSY